MSLRIWDYALEEEEIQERMNKPLNGDEDWLLAYYNFDQTEGDTLTDLSGNEYDGALMNFEGSGWTSSSGTARGGIRLNRRRWHHRYADSDRIKVCQLSQEPTRTHTTFA